MGTEKASGRQNPAAALDALTHPASTPCGRFEVREYTLGALAILDEIGSPFLRKDAPKTLPAFVETMFAMTRPSAESRRLLARSRDAFAAAAAEWADGVSVREGAELLSACSAAIARFAAANPAEDGGGEPEEDDPDPTTAGPTAG